MQLVDELLAYWRVEDAESTLEELEDLLIVSETPLAPQAVSHYCQRILLSIAIDTRDGDAAMLLFKSPLLAFLHRQALLCYKQPIGPASFKGVEHCHWLAPGGGGGGLNCLLCLEMPSAA